jgi:mycothiol synthase
VDNSRGEGATTGVEAATEQDLAGVAALVSAAESADGVGPLSDHSRLHSARGGGTNLVVRGSDARLAAFGHLDLEPDADGAAPATGELVVHPERRRQGLGTAMLRALTARAGSAGLQVWAHGRLPAAVALADRLGLHQVRELRQMHRSLTGPDVELPPETGVPDDLRLRSFRVGEDEPEWLRVNALAFAGYPEQGGWTADDLRDREQAPWFDPSGFLVLEPVDRPGTIAGYHWTKQHERAGEAPLGEVHVVGLDPAYQGRGLGSLLTLAGLRYLRSRGLTDVILYVDGENAPALATYGRLGFETSLIDVMYATPA